MPVQRLNIEHFIELSAFVPVIDVRSPGEFKHTHFPCAKNLPLFSDEERKIVGTTYKQKSREEAIRIGLDFFGPKMRNVVEEAEKLVRDFGSDKGSQVLIYCWRGGMRSAAIAWLLDLYGFKVYTLAGGYKKFRNYVLNLFSLPHNFRLIGGYTGSGKTITLQKLRDSGQAVIDLEGIAVHRGSAFGNIGLPQQPSQEMFENLLGLELKKWVGPANDCSTPVWIEDESQRIGIVNVPMELWKTMRRSPLYFLEIPFEERLNFLVEEYGKLDRSRLLDGIDRIREKLGGLQAKQAKEFLEEGNTLESFRILLNYYDKLYLKALHNRDSLNTLLHSIGCQTVSSENANLLSNQYQPL